MSMILLLKVVGIGLMLIVFFIFGSLLNLYSQVSRYKKYWDTANNSHTENALLTYVALGDSSAQGVGASRPEKGYVGLIRDQLATELDGEVRTLNLSKSGAKLEDVIKDQVPQLEKLNDNLLLTMQAGANDMSDFEEGKFKTEMNEIMSRLPARSVVSDVPYFGDTRFKNLNENVQKANKIIRELAAEHDVRLVPLYDRIKTNGGLKTLAVDLFHPSDYSYKHNWAPIFWEGIDKEIDSL